jgi:PKHD-type hydroxylase
MLCIANILSPPQLEEIRALLAHQPFESGSKTAGWSATLVKNNEQLSRSAAHYDQLQKFVLNTLVSHEMFALAAMPKTMRPLLFSRYTSGMGYGDHVDNALMGDKPSMRSDLSFTLFLSGPADYEGGELVIEDTTQGTLAHKLEAGSLVLYESSSLHRVEPVRSGIRQVAVGWVQCLVRDPRQRQILFDLEVLRRQIFQQQGKTAQFDTLSKTASNLMRMWVDS